MLRSRLQSARRAAAAFDLSALSLPAAQPSSRLLRDSRHDVDVAVIGGGSGGLACAHELAAECGARVALFDYVSPSPAGTSWGLGGTCVNVGCIPKKLLHQAALRFTAARSLDAGYGISCDSAMLRWSQLIENVQNYLHSLNFGYRSRAAESGVQYVNEHARFLDQHTLQGHAGTRISADHIVVSVGGRPILPDIPGIGLAITSDDIFSLPSPPGRTLVVGAGYIGLEVAGILAMLAPQSQAPEVTLAMRSVPLRGFDQQMAQLVLHSLRDDCKVDVRAGAVAASLHRVTQSDRIRVTFTDGHTDCFDSVVMAIGRASSASSTDPARAAVELDTQGKVRQAPAHIHAIGDCSSETSAELTPVAIRQGRALAKAIATGHGDGFKPASALPLPPVAQLVPETVQPRSWQATCVFTPLEYACVGLAEEEAQAVVDASPPIAMQVYHTYYTPLSWVLSMPPQRSNACYAKIITLQHGDGDEIVAGVHMFGPHAGDIVQGAAIAMQAGASKAAFDATVGIHPTCAEELTTLSINKASGRDPRKSAC